MLSEMKQEVLLKSVATDNLYIEPQIDVLFISLDEGMFYLQRHNVITLTGW